MIFEQAILAIKIKLIFCAILKTESIFVLVINHVNFFCKLATKQSLSLGSKIDSIISKEQHETENISW